MKMNNIVTNCCAVLLLALLLAGLTPAGAVRAAEDEEASGEELAAAIADAVPLATEQAAGDFAAEQGLAADYDPQDALVLACALKRPGIARYLLEEGGATVTDRSPGFGALPLHAACFNNSLECAALLLVHDADPSLNIGGDEGTPLHQAAMGGATEIAALLLAFDPDLEARNDLGVTPLHDAANSNAAAVAVLLLDAGAKVDALTQIEGNTALLLAANMGSLETASILLEYGAAVNFAEPSLGLTPLHIAAFGGQAGVAQILLEAGADRSKKTLDGQSAADLAARQGFAELAEMLK